MHQKSIIAIPARLDSSRLPNKLIAKINGSTMLERVIKRCQLNKQSCKVVLCTDNSALEIIGKECGIKVFKTSKDCSSGTERIASVLEEILSFMWAENFVELNNTEKIEILKQSNVINVQGDQPFINPEIIDEMVKQINAKSCKSEIITPIYELKPENIHNPNVVKTLISNESKHVIYFSRSAIPHIRDVPPENWHKHNKYWGHVGIYGFRADVLYQWEKMPLSNLESLERLEQLRFIEAGYTIGSFLTEGESLSIDTPNQLEEARKISIERNIY